MPKTYSYKNTLYACYIGYITQAIVVNLSPLLFVIFQEEFHISYTRISALILINFVTQFCTDIVATRYADRIGYRKSACIAHGCAVTGLIGLGVFPLLLPPYAGLLVATVFCGVGGGLIEVLISPIVDSLPGDAKASSMSLLHAFYCWGQMLTILVTTVLLKVLGGGLWKIVPLFWALLPLGNLFLFRKVPLIPPVSAADKTPLKKLLGNKFFLLSMLLMICSGASELSMAQWASLFAEKALGVPKIWGDLLGPCLFAVFMGIGRTIYGVYGNKIPLRRALVALSLLGCGCYLLAALCQIPLLSLLACALTGFAVSLMWPGMLSCASSMFPKGGTTMFGILAVCGDIGCSVGPFLTGIFSDAAQQNAALVQFGANVGLTADQMGLRCGLLFAILFPLIMCIGASLLPKKMDTLK